MNKQLYLFLIFSFCASTIYAQLFPFEPREWNENYSYTVFSDSFNGTSLDDDKWNVQTNYGRGECVFMDLEGTTYSESGGYLRLSMLYDPGHCFIDNGITICDHDFIAAEISSKESYKYGVYEGRMKFAYDNGSWPAFWLFGGAEPDDPQYDGYATEIDIAEHNWHWDHSVSTDHVLHMWTGVGQQMSIPSCHGVKKNNVDWDQCHRRRPTFNFQPVICGLEDILFILLLKAKSINSN